MSRIWVWSTIGLLACGKDGDELDCDPVYQWDAWTDSDADGAGDPDTKTKVCALADDQVTNGDDCDDSNPDVSPFAAETCDGVDENCDGTPDDGLPAGTWYGDEDGDGQGDPDARYEGCMQPADSVQTQTDCDDTNPAVYVGAPEVCDGVDNNCDLLADDDDPTVDRTTGSWFYRDDDGDTFGADASGIQSCENPNPSLVPVGGDCNDANDAIFPTQTEVCNLLDDNCDLLIDEDDPLLDWGTAQTFFEDDDLDGVGDSLAPIDACFVDAGLSSVDGDCNDADPAIGLPPLWVHDADADGFGAGAPIGAASCVSPAPDAIPDGGPDDCRDQDPAVYPGAPEVCDGADNDCDLLTDDADPGVDVSAGDLYYRDDDGDGYGEGIGVRSCANPNVLLYATGDGDCDDTDDQVFPGNPEVCDAADNDCDLLVDEDDPSLDPATLDTFLEDLDNDGYGNNAVQIDACFDGPGISAVGGDCNDQDPSVFAPISWQLDGDGDGFGAGGALGGPTCVQPDPDAVPFGPEDDCSDADPSIYPGAPEICADGIDQDCDGVDCSDYTQDFELGPPLPAEFSTSGNAVWRLSTAQAHGGVYSGTNGNIGDNQISNLSLVLDFPAGGTIEFWHMGDTELNYDFLIFSIDGVQRISRSGVWGWTFAQFNVAAGTHTLTWVYDKDSSLSTVADAVWIDDLVAVGGAP